MQVCHRDIKPSNLFLDSDGSIKLGDFGVSRILFEAIEPFTETDTRAGTKKYMAPEVINREQVCPALKPEPKVRPYHRAVQRQGGHLEPGRHSL